MSNRHIVCLSGGVASAVVAKWVKENIKGEIIYYFNDTLWEDKDLYRFNKDLEKKLNIKITVDCDGRTPEQVFYDCKMLGSNRTPICSKILKAHMLQKFVKRGDNLYFGIDHQEIHRTIRIKEVYDLFDCKCIFPLIDNFIFKPETFKIIKSLRIEIPQMYKEGYSHNNCNGRCVRQGKGNWISTLVLRPRVYMDSERIEIEFSKATNERRLKKDSAYKPRRYSYLKDTNLTELRESYEKGNDLDLQIEPWRGECVGICGEGV